MELRQLKYFKAVADHSSFTRAASELRIAQPALSRQVRSLEDELGVTLFYRDGRGAHLSVEGATLYGHYERIEERLKLAREEVTSFRGYRRTLSFGVVPSLGPACLARLGLRFQSSFPDTRLSLIEDYSHHLSDWLKSGRLDAALMYGSHLDGRTECYRYANENLFLFSGPQHSLPPKIELSKVADFPLISPVVPSTSRSELERVSSIAGVDIRFDLQIDCFPAIFELVSTGEFFAVLPATSAIPRIRDGSLNCSLIVDPTPNLEICLAVAPGLERDRTVIKARKEIMDDLANQLNSQPVEAFASRV